MEETDGWDNTSLGVNCDYLVCTRFYISNFLGIINSTEESLFTYNEEESWSTFYQPDFVPFFEPTFSSSVLEQQANAVCGDDIFCQYDIAATGRTDIGQATLESNMELERIINISLPGTYCMSKEFILLYILILLRAI